MRRRRSLLLSQFILARSARADCEPYCVEHCATLNGYVHDECNDCVDAAYLCRPGTAGYDNWKVGATLEEEPSSSDDEPAKPPRAAVREGPRAGRRESRWAIQARAILPPDIRAALEGGAAWSDDDDGAAPASHYLPSLLIATSAGATTVAPPGRAARERGRPALCANVLDEFVRALLPQLDLTSGGPARGLHAPPGPNGPLQGRHVPPALLPPHRPLTYPACRFLFSPSAHKEFAVDLN